MPGRYRNYSDKLTGDFSLLSLAHTKRAPSVSVYLYTTARRFINSFAWFTVILLLFIINSRYGGDPGKKKLHSFHTASLSRASWQFVPTYLCAWCCMRAYCVYIERYKYTRRKKERESLYIILSPRQHSSLARLVYVYIRCVQGVHARTQYAFFAKKADAWFIINFLVVAGWLIRAIPIAASWSTCY